VVRALALALAALLLAGCAGTRGQLAHAPELAESRRDASLDCDRPDRCALASPLYELAEGLPEGRHRVLLLEQGQDALFARINLIRSARERIELQTYIFAEDDSGYFVLLELLAAARRGVKVRLLLDQLFSLDNPRLLAALAESHVNFEVRLYNPLFERAVTGPVRFVTAIFCCFTQLNQRMHNKLLLVDGRLGMTGGRNVQNRYFDWDAGFNYRDRDILVAGPAARDMLRAFDEYWQHPRARDVAALRDVGRLTLSPDPLQRALPEPVLGNSQRLLDLSAQVDQPAIAAELAAEARLVEGLRFLSDPPSKQSPGERQASREVSAHIRRQLVRSEREVLLQTPYLVLSRSAQTTFRELQQRPDPPEVRISTNSLAATDAFPVYALSHKYKRRYLREFGFRIHEYKPFPLDAPIDLDATGAGIPPDALGRYASESRRFGGWRGSGARDAAGSGYGSGRPVPLREAGVRISLHSKSMVIDRRLALVGTHNFDPRSDRLNTENAVLIEDAEFAGLLAEVLLRDMAPENAWVIAPRQRLPLVSGLQYSLAKTSEFLPLFDIWPWRYATSYELREGCEPMPPRHPDFHACHDPVGDFPEVQLGLKGLYTRILTAFGAGLAPIL
jgi:cardiolipin synthase C